MEEEEELSQNPEKDARSKKEEFLIEAKNFFDFYKKELGDSIRKANNVIHIDFLKLTEFSNKLSDESRFVSSGPPQRNHRR